MFFVEFGHFLVLLHPHISYVQDLPGKLSFKSRFKKESKRSGSQRTWYVAANVLACYKSNDICDWIIEVMRMSREPNQCRLRFRGVFADFWIDMLDWRFNSYTMIVVDFWDAGVISNQVKCVLHVLRQMEPENLVWNTAPKFQDLLRPLQITFYHQFGIFPQTQRIGRFWNWLVFLSPTSHIMTMTMKYPKRLFSSSSIFYGLSLPDANRRFLRCLAKTKIRHGTWNIIVIHKYEIKLWQL